MAARKPTSKPPETASSNHAAGPTAGPVTVSITRQNLERAAGFIGHLDALTELIEVRDGRANMNSLAGAFGSILAEIQGLIEENTTVLAEVEKQFQAAIDSKS